jgi:flagellar biosynthesis/type III secretory pathway protein FliH
MSSSESRTPAPAPWALDELALDEVFTPLYELPGHAPVAPASSHAPANASRADEAGAALEASVEARVAERLAALRPAIEREAYARGQADGQREGAELAREPIGRVLQALVEATGAVRAHEQRWLGNVEENLAAVAVTIARHLIQRELATDPSVVTDLVARALRQFPLERQVTVRLHPDDHAIVQDALAAGALASADTLEVHWLADAHIVRGGCLVEGRERVLDGRMDTALERAYRALGQVQA